MLIRAHKLSLIIRSSGKMMLLSKLLPKLASAVRREQSSCKIQL